MTNKLLQFNKNMPTSKKLLIIYLIAGCAISIIFAYVQYRDRNTTYDSDVIIKYSDTEVWRLPPISKCYKVPYRSAPIEITILSLSYSVASCCTIFSIYFFITRLKRLKWWKTYLITLLFSTGLWFFITTYMAYGSYFSSVRRYYSEVDFINWGIFNGYILGYTIPFWAIICFLVSIFVFIIVFFILSIISYIVNFKNKKAKVI